MLIFSFSYAQEFGGEPASVKWKQVNNDTVKIIFPAGMDSIAKRVATITSGEQLYFASTIGNLDRKVNIVLHNQTVFSNGFVALGPRRSEFFLTPEQNAFELSAVSWNDLLSIHEYRHVEQYNNFNVGLSHAMHILFGQNGQALANAASVPDWFFEGDAVYNETLLSTQGRGRLPLFLNGYKSLYLENRYYSYMKLRNGSYRNFVPNHYPLGYMLVAYGREKYGDDFWKDVTHDAASFSSLFYPLQKAIKKHAGISFTDFTQQAFNYYRRQWQGQGQSYSNLMFIDSAEKHTVTNHLYPYITDNGSIITLQNSYKSIPQFIIRRSNGAAEKIAVEDITTNDYYSYNNGIIVYASFKPDARWGNREFSEIRLIHIHTKKEQKITSRSRYFSPDISHNGNMIVTIEQATDGSSKLILLDVNGNTIRTITNEQGCVFSYPKFSADDKYIYVCNRKADGEMGILRKDVEGKSQKVILPYSNRIVGFPVVQGDTLLYSCSNNGGDEIWAYINTENKNYRIASAATGLYQAGIRNNTIITAAFTADGYKLAAIKPQWQQINETDTLKSLYVSHPFQKPSNQLLNNIAGRDFTVKSYSRLSGFFNFHSYNPYISDPDYSFILYGQNVLNTVQSQLYYTYNRDEQFSRVGYTGIYGGWYLQPFININQTWNRTARLNADTVFHWNETNFSGGLQLPLNFAGGKLYRNLTTYASYNYVSTQWAGLAKTYFKNAGFSYAQLRLYYSQYAQQAVQHINPRFGQSIILQYRTGGTAHQLLASGYLYFPGLSKNHSIVINLAYQQRDTSGKYYYDNNFPFSRGYATPDYPRMYKAGFNYNFPLAYPDWGFGNIAYCLRIRGNLFYDFTQTKSLRTGNRFNFASAGAEIFFDTKWWNQQFISFGLRYSRLLNSDLAGRGPNQWEVILPLSLY
ncbi:TolB family protein [Parafilimonas sp.]|uniref:TolB family protein n=1 Tax=Parafilimonas sp. TaxID=1969739 RepID=UPI0039E4EF07